MDEKTLISIEHLLATWVKRLRTKEPATVAILCRGSFARHEPEPWSDLDLDLLFTDRQIDEYRSAFGEPFYPHPPGVTPTQTANTPPLHVTIACRTLSDRLREIAEPCESEAWAFFLEARERARLLWVRPDLRDQIPEEITVKYRLSPQLQDLLECAAKVRNSVLRGDSLGARLAARDLAVHVPALVALANPPVCVETRRGALAAALAFRIAPPAYRERLLCCLGLTEDRPANLADQALELARGTVELLKPRAQEIASQLEPGLADALADGTLDRLLA